MTATEAVWVRIGIGALPRGARVRVSTPDGVSLGSAAPFGPQPRGQQASASYDIALPPDAFAGGRARLRVEIIEPGGAVRAPLPGEVESVELRYVPVTR